MKRSILILMSTLVPFVTQADRAESMGRSIVLDGVAAHVNQHVVTIGEVMALVQPVHRQLSKTRAGNKLKAGLLKAYEEALGSLIDRHLILDSYEKENEGRNVEIPEWLVDRRVNEIIHDIFKDDRTALMAALSKDRMTFDEWRNEIRDHIVAASMRGLNVEQNVRISPLKVRASYDRNIESYRTPEKVKLRMIVLKKDADGKDAALRRRQAEDARARLRAGEDFAVLARKLSDGSKSDDDGNWGWIEPKILRPELARTVKGLKLNEISKAVETEEEIYILTIEGRRDESVAPFRDVQPQIERELRQEKTERLHRIWIDNLRKNAYVKIFDVNLF